METTTLIMGPPRTGKSTLAMQYSTNGAANESNLYASHEIQTNCWHRLRRLLSELAVDVHIKHRSHRCYMVDPVELLRRIRHASARLWNVAACTLPIIDSLNGYLIRSPGEESLVNQLHEMSAYLNQKGVVTTCIGPNTEATSGEPGSVKPELSRRRRRERKDC